MSNKFILLIGTGLAAILLSIQLFLNQSKPANPESVFVGPYDLGHPDKEVKLPKDLREISGLTWWKDGLIAGIQDEDGYVFIIDVENGDIVEKRKFNKDGDYEGIAKVKRDLYIVRNDGDLYKVKKFNSRKKAEKFENDLGLKNDVEGLCYDSDNDRLLLACKERSHADKHKKKHRGIFAYDLDEKELIKKPVFQIDEEELADFLGVKRMIFKPSALAIQPETKDIYVLSSVAKSLIVLDQEGVLKSAYSLPRSIFRQPEGIAFDTEFNLYISNEGRDKKATMLKFKHRS